MRPLLDRWYPLYLPSKRLNGKMCLGYDVEEEDDDKEEFGTHLFVIKEDGTIGTVDEFDRYYIGSGEPRILREYLYHIRNIIAPDLELGIGYYDDDGLPMEEQWLDMELFNKETGFVCLKSFDEYVESRRL